MNPEAKTEKTEKKYFEAIGRRKTAAAQVRMWPGSKASVTINGGKDLEQYFKTDEQRRVAMEALTNAKAPEKFKITALIRGGGANGQSEALRLGIARALILYDAELRKQLKKAGFLKRDSRAKERRKFGLKKARKAPQWSKR